MKGKWIVMVLVVVLAMSITPGWAQEKTMFGPEADLKGTISIYARSYTPLEPTAADRWPPPTYLWTIIEEYEKIHPNVHVKIIQGVASGEAVTWTQTRLVSGTAPEVCWGQSRSDVYVWARSGLLVAMDPYLNMPNPYIPGNKKWIDILDPSVIATIRAPDGKVYTINGDLVTTGILYNADIFEELGLTEPKIWADFMTVLGKIESAGHIIPMSFQGAEKDMGWTWLARFIYYPLYRPLMDKMDVIPEEKPGLVNRKEMALAWKKGIETITSDRFKTGVQLQKEFSQYWSPGFLGLTASMAYDQFVTGKAAMHLNGSWQIKAIKADPYRKFNWGMFPFPPITSETSPYAYEPGVVKGLTLGGPSAGFQFNVPVSAKDGGLLEEAVDFLMFLSAPQNAGPLIADLGSYMPSIKGIEPPEELKAVFYKPGEAEFIDLKMLSPGYLNGPKEAIDLCYKTWQLFIGEQISTEQAVSQWNKDMDYIWNKMIQESEWDFSEYGVK